MTLFGVFFCARAVIITAHVAYNGSPSMPLGLYQLNPNHSPEHAMESVIFCPPPTAVAYLRSVHPEQTSGGRCADGSKEFLKIAAALPGDVVTLNAMGVSVNGNKPLPGSVPLRVTGIDTAHARYLPHYIYGTYRVPAGSVWSYTPEWFSFDSRYYGPVKITGTAKSFLIYTPPNPQSTIPMSILKLQYKPHD